MAEDGQSPQIEILPAEKKSPGPVFPAPTSGAPAGKVEGDIAQKNFIHPASALVLMAIDFLWTLAEWKVFTLVITIPLSFVTVSVATGLIQKFVNHDTTGKAVAIGFLLGFLAAIPTPITGTIVGVMILTLAGLKRR
ncbi:hypothetical protein QQ056_16250 [Oscillatoria laete-virens NRMC-F 0139]|nr:hypothetical protein [Oscillatoria laete-virens]MDL5055089.1 hypothetical protein [Oscillatoria laete-virens NRMC-F 0139]